MERLLTYADIMENDQCSRVTVYRRIKAGLLPKPILISPGCPRIKESEYLASREAMPRSKYTRASTS